MTHSGINDNLKEVAGETGADYLEILKDFKEYDTYNVVLSFRVPKPKSDTLVSDAVLEIKKRLKQSPLMQELLGEKEEEILKLSKKVEELTRYKTYYDMEFYLRHGPTPSVDVRKLATDTCPY